MKMRNLLTRRDALLAGGLAGLSLMPLARAAKAGVLADVYVGRQKVACLSLRRNGTYIIEGKRGAATLEVANGQVRVKSAPCAGKRCVNRGWLQADGHSAVCVPNRMAVTVRAEGAKSPIDAVAG